MPRMLLIWSLFFGLALAGADWYVEHGREPAGVAAAPSDSEGLAVATDDGTPMPHPPK